MRKEALSILTLLVVLSNVFSQERIEDNPDVPRLKGSYLGQKPPKDKAEIFGPDIISTNENEALFGIFNEGAYIIFDRIPTGFSDWAKDPVYTIREVNGQWTDPVLTKHLGKPWYFDFPNPKDGDEIIYAWWLPFNEDGEVFDINLWKVKYNKNQWNEPIKFPYPINTKYFDTWPSVTKDGVLYFFSKREGGFGDCDIYRSEPENGVYKTVENLGERINTIGTEGDPYISADESFLIFTSYREGSYGEDDLYVSFQEKNGEWSLPVNLGEKINSESSENRPYLTSDGKYLFFTSTRNGNTDIFWVDTKIIMDLKRKSLIKH